MLKTKTYSYYCQDLNDGKLDILKLKAINLRKFKNEISMAVCDNPLLYINETKFDWINSFRIRIDQCNNQDISNAISDVFVSYQNKRDKFIKNTKIKSSCGFKKELYKRNGKNFKKGDIKQFEQKFKDTRLSMVVTYLVRYYNETLIDYIKNNKSLNQKQQSLRDDVIHYINKFGDRLICLVKSIQSRVINNVFKNPINFESLTFTSTTEQKQNIIVKNKNTHSVYNAYIILSGQKTPDGKIIIPTKHSDRHHGNIKNYYKELDKKNQRRISYTVLFERNNRIRIVLSRQKDEMIVRNKTKYYGVDVNVKHNLFCDKHNNTIDYDRKLFDDYISFIKKCDSKLKFKKEKKEKVELCRRDKLVKSNWQVRIKDMLKRKSNYLVKQAIELGMDHIVMEDLQLMGKSYGRSEEFMDFKYSRLIRLLNLANLKNIVSGIAAKNGLQCTFIQPHYTSQTCDKCGNIEKGNRVVQEEFKCTACGFESNADTHSASNIEDRLKVDVLRLSLLNESNGLFTLKRLSKESIKNILLDCYDNNSAMSEIEQFI